jgi:hypothetical protein
LLLVLAVMGHGGGDWVRPLFLASNLQFMISN